MEIALGETVMDAQAQQWFYQVDADRSGTIDVRELQQIIAQTTALQEAFGYPPMLAGLTRL